MHSLNSQVDDLNKNLHSIKISKKNLSIEELSNLTWSKKGIGDKIAAFGYRIAYLVKIGSWITDKRIDKKLNEQLGTIATKWKAFENNLNKDEIKNLDSDALQKLTIRIKFASTHLSKLRSFRIVKQLDKIIRNDSTSLLMSLMVNKNDKEASKLVENLTFKQSTLPLLHRAIFNDCPKTAIAMIGRGSNVNQKDTLGNTPLHLALKGGTYVNLIDSDDALLRVQKNIRTDVIKVLIHKGAKITDSDIDLCIKGNRSRATAKLLIKGGVSQQKMILRALEMGNDSLASYLLQKFDIKRIPNLLNLAIAGNCPRAAVNVIEKGINIHQKDESGLSSLFLALEKEQNSVVDALAAHGAKVNEVINGKLPLHIAIERNNYKLANTLITFGADPLYSGKGFKSAMELNISNNFRKLFESALKSYNI